MNQVVVVEDEKITRGVVIKVLKMLFGKKYKIIGFERAQEAANYIDDKAIFLVISDIDMPAKEGDKIKNGLELLDWLCENHPDTIVIIMSGGHSQEEAKKAKVFIKKPFRLAEFSEKIEKAMES